MTNETTFSNAPIDYVAYELQARQLRAEALRTWFVAARNFFAGLSVRGAHTQTSKA